MSRREWVPTVEWEGRRWVLLEGTYCLGRIARILPNEWWNAARTRDRDDSLFKTMAEAARYLEDQ